MRKMSEEFERKATLLARDAREKQLIEVQSEMRKFQEAVAKNQAEMEKRQQELIQPIVRKMNTIIANLGIREGFTIILNRSEQTVLFASHEVDLTDAVVRAYNRDKS